MQQGNAFLDRFIIRQLIFVNSAAYAYTEIRVDQHTALFGRNNLGKTSMLNALKLFLLPEENFRACEKKFGFKGANGKEYEGPESYQYYFPEDRSFIILEAENVHGTFCLVLHRGGRELSYGRMAVPCAYAELRHLFWDFASTENAGLGSPIAELSLKGLLSELTLLKAEPLGDVKTLKDRLFSEKQLDPRLGRFCLLPLKQGGTAGEIKAWRQLIHLAFDISAKDEQTLPTAVATIIEGEKQRDAEKVSVDFAAILQNYNDLKAAGDRLQLIQNHLPDWQKFDDNYRQYERDSHNVAQQYLNLTHALDKHELLNTEALEKANKDQKACSEAYEKNRKQFLNADGELKGLAGQLKSDQQKADRLNQSLAHIAKIASEYPDYFDQEQLESALKAHRDGLQLTYESLQNAESRQRRMEDLIKESKHYQTTIAQRTDLLAQEGVGFLDSLDVDTAAVLFNLNDRFSSLQVTPDNQQRDVIQQFAALFSHSDQGLSFLNQHLINAPLKTYNVVEQRQRWEREREDAQSSLRKVNVELSDLGKLSKESSSELQMSLAHKRKELEVTRTDLDLIKSHSLLKQEADDYVEQIDLLKGQQATLKQQKEKASEHADLLSKSLSAADQVVNGLLGEQRSMNEQSSQLGMMKDSYAPVITAWLTQLVAEPTEVNDEMVATLRKRFYALQQLGETMRQQMAELLKAGLLEADTTAGFLTLSFKDLKQYRQQLKQAFDTLDAGLHNHRDSVRAHNKETSIKMEELQGAAKQISTFGQEINQQFRQYTLSNLVEIQVSFTLHPRFKQLLSELDQINFHTDELHDARLYTRLNDFCDEFFKRTSSSAPTLSMDQIIQKVFYRYKLEGQEQFDDKEQSNGTTSMVNCLLLSILIKRLLRNDAAICIPLVMDEMGSLDRENLQTATRIAENHGFVLFGASPDISAEIVAAVKNYVNLGSFSATTASYSDKRRVIFHSHCERLYREDNSSNDNHSVVSDAEEEALQE